MGKRTGSTARSTMPSGCPTADTLSITARATKTKMPLLRTRSSRFDPGGFYREKALPLDAGAAVGLGAEEAGGVDQLLDGRLIFAAGLQKVDADRATHWND